MSWRETNSPTTIPFWARCDNPFHLFVLTTFFTQVSLVTLGHRAGRSSAFGLADAELLSASSRPNSLPSRCACCVALTPLSKRHFFEVISCAVKGRTSLRTAGAGHAPNGWPTMTSRTASSGWPASGFRTSPCGRRRGGGVRMHWLSTSCRRAGQRGGGTGPRASA
jgi:hypothetical protein